VSPKHDIPGSVGAQVIKLANGALRLMPTAPITSFSRYAEVKIQADGSILLEPFPEEIKPEKAAAILGINRRTLYDLLCDYNCRGEALIKSRRPSPHRIWIETASVHAHLARTRDPELWTEAGGGR